MKSTEIQDKIDNYLLAKMSEVEKENFENELSTNADLNEKVAIQKLIVEEMRSRAAFNKAIATKTPVISFHKAMMITLSAAAIFLGVFFINQSVVNNRMDNMFASNLAATQVEITRGNETFRGNDAEFIDLFFAAEDSLQNGKIKQAKAELLKLYTLESDFEYYEEIRWYLALAELKLHQKSKAKKHLNELVDSDLYGQRVKDMLEKL